MTTGRHTSNTSGLAGLHWRKSSRSGQGGGACVEVAPGQAVVGVRDSKNPSGPALLFDSGVWAAFVRSL
ncbi:hypothetical protein GCM10027271_50220 [Saccharopolyspora gloriosae]|uniref:DUF397 domain-containing protein n=1 Tax=Saccharopolyspora gloriosae TaxID=455344 RepID=A0A840NBV6_9PSEU|nr:DUF397 domain-containing protein [Saccharopolyspora gloriosae]MBB5068401.1 hypothetical protein [Saccharopolyspora gloriosae]